MSDTNEGKRKQRRMFGRCWYQPNDIFDPKEDMVFVGEVFADDGVVLWVGAFDSIGALEDSLKRIAEFLNELNGGVYTYRYIPTKESSRDDEMLVALAARSSLIQQASQSS